MFLIDKLAEKKITEAIERGELNDLPGAAQPLDLGDDAMVPEELRAGYRLLKNAGYLPPDVQLRKEIQSVDSLILRARSEEERHSLSKRLRYVQMQLSIASQDTPVFLEPYYMDKLSRKPGGRVSVFPNTCCAAAGLPQSRTPTQDLFS